MFMGNNVPLKKNNSNLNDCNSRIYYSQSSVELCQIPNLKAIFFYVQPLTSQNQQIPQQQQILHFDINEQSVNSSEILATNQLIEFSTVESIRVKWNLFIKMKYKNYLQDYQVIKRIGKGGYGIVNKVKNIYTFVNRAAKIIKKPSLKQNHKKLLEQLSIMKQLDHPNIIKLYQVYQYQQQYVLILQLSEGGELYQRIKTKKNYEQSIQNFMRQIIKTLVYLHSQKIIHRDLKPQNMMFEGKNSNNIKLIDFGLATKLLQNQTQYDEQSYLDTRVGTLSYMAPEVIYKKYNQKCDVWSAGVIFYFMVSGMMPFSGQNENELIQSILHDEISFENSGWSKFSVQCRQLIKLMLQKKQQLRPSASQVLKNKWFSMILSPLNNNNNTNNNTFLDKKKRQQIITNIRNFSFRNKLQAITNTYIASQLLSGELRQTMNEAFFQIDLDHNGVISSQQLKIALSKTRQISMEYVEYLKNVIDTNGNGEIQYTQFLVASLNYEDFMKKDYFQKAFAYFDIDHDGKITYEEVEMFLDNQDTQYKQQDQVEIRKMFQEIDVDKNGYIDLGDNEYNKQNNIDATLKSLQQWNLLNSSQQSDLKKSNYSTNKFLLPRSNHLIELTKSKNAHDNKIIENVNLKKSNVNTIDIIKQHNKRSTITIYSVKNKQNNYREQMNKSDNMKKI